MQFFKSCIFLTGELPSPSLPPTIFGKVLLRTIYLCHALALFTQNSKGTYIKPTESLSETAYNIIKKYYKNNKGFWIWICWSKDTDTAPKVQQKSYIIGAVYISAIIPTKEFRKNYKKQRAMAQYTHSKNDAYQAIIPMHSCARLELKNYIEVHEYTHDAGENRQHGVWQPKKSAKLYTLLAKAEFN